jgi:hypothetical protein
MLVSRLLLGVDHSSHNSLFDKMHYWNRKMRAILRLTKGDTKIKYEALLEHLSFISIELNKPRSGLLTPVIGLIAIATNRSLCRDYCVESCHS